MQVTPDLGQFVVERLKPHEVRAATMGQNITAKFDMLRNAMHNTAASNGDAAGALKAKDQAKLVQAIAALQDGLCERDTEVKPQKSLTPELTACRQVSNVEIRKTPACCIIDPLIQHMHMDRQPARPCAMCRQG